jgi:hypothetical protein
MRAGPTCIFWAGLTPFSPQLVRAGAAGVGRVVLTGCDMEGSRKGRAVAEWWLARRRELAAEGYAWDDIRLSLSKNSY